MNYVRIILFSLLGALGWWISSNNFTLVFSEEIPPIVEVSGILNIWGGLSCLFFGVYLTIYVVKEQFMLHLPIGEINRVFIVGAIASLALSIVFKQQISSNTSEYVECADLRKLSSRYSSHTYAVSEELCQQALEEKAKRRR